MKIISLKELATYMNLKTAVDATIRGVSVDSRLTKPGDLFFALPGAKVDGHSFLSTAAEKGAVAAVVRENYHGSDYGLPLIRSGDVLHSLQQLAQIYLRKSQAKIVAITGSLGKTTTKEFLHQLLKTKFKVSASPGNSNSQIGLPLAVLNDISLEDEVTIFEMGMTESGQISKLIEIAPPDIAVVTKVALVHACYFDSLADIARSKAEIFTHPKTRLGIYHYDSDIEAILRNSGTCDKLSFSTISRNADYFLYGDASKTIVNDYKKTFAGAGLPLPGDHTRHNFLDAAVVASNLGMEWPEIMAVIPSLTLPERRMQRVEKYGITFINDSYNAAEMSIKAALDCLPEPKKGGKRIAVIGGIVELGKFSRDCHRAVGEYALDRVDEMFCFGAESHYIMERWQEAGRHVVWSQERSGIIEPLRACMKEGDVVLLKGSRDKNVGKVLEEL